MVQDDQKQSFNPGEINTNTPPHCRRSGGHLSQASNSHNSSRYQSNRSGDNQVNNMKQQQSNEKTRTSGSRSSSKGGRCIGSSRNHDERSNRINSNHNYSKQSSRHSISHNPIIEGGNISKRNEGQKKDNTNHRSKPASSVQRHPPSNNNNNSQNDATVPNWRSSSAKKELTKELLNETSDIRKMSIREIHASSRKYSGYKYANFHQNVDRLAKKLGVVLPLEVKKKSKQTKASKSSNTKTKNQQPDWRTSQEKRMLYKLLMNEKSGLQGMSPEQIYNSHKGFKKWELTKFKTYLKYLVKITTVTKMKIKFEEEAFWKETIAFPRRELTNRGYPFWGYHPADKLLKEDVKSGRAYSLKPLALWGTRKEYQQFPPRVFLKHIHQEKRSHREAGYWNIKLKKDADRERDKEAEAMKNEWEERMLNGNDEYDNDEF
jgi:hypothetical protein